MKNKKSQQSRFLPEFHFSRINVLIFAIGIALLVVGFWLMSIGPWDNPLSRTVAPLILLLAYMVVFPMSIFYDTKKNIDVDKNSAD